MKKYILVLSLFISTLALAQPPADKPEDKPGDKSVSNEHLKRKPEEKKKKDKKPRTFRLIGVEASTGNYYYKNIHEQGRPSTTSDIYSKFIDESSPFFTYFGTNTPTIYDGFSPLTSSVYYPNNKLLNNGTQTDFTTTWGFGKRGDVNQKHVIKIGFGLSDRQYTNTYYNNVLYSDLDTLSYTYLGGDTLANIRDTSSVVAAYINNSISMGHISIAYNYRLHSDEKLSLSFGGGMDLSLGTYRIAGSIDQSSSSFYYTRNISNTPNWYYQDNNQNNISKLTQLANIDETPFKAAMFRPYITVRVDYRLSKKIPILKNINLFVDGRFGKEFSNIGNKMLDKSPTFYSLKFGVAFNFFKGL